MINIICAGIITMHSHNKKAWYYPSCLLQTYCHFRTNAKLSANFGQTYVITKKGSDRKRMPETVAWSSLSELSGLRDTVQQSELGRLHDTVQQSELGWLCDTVQQSELGRLHDTVQQSELGGLCDKVQQSELGRLLDTVQQSELGGLFL